MIRLFLNNREVELNSSVSFAINKQFEDITSPADIKNDWSKTVQIPFTQSNNKLFGELFKVDRLIVEGDSTLMGIYFDPYKKVDFRLQWGDAIIMQGYAKNIDVVKSANGEGHYNITLNGELGKVFQEMKKITFDTTTDDKKYLIDGSKYVDSVINKDLVYELWNNEPDLENLDLVENTDSNYRIRDYIGFIPNNSYDDDFDYKTFQKQDSYNSMKFAELLDEQARIVTGNTEASYQTVVGIAADTVIGDGLLPREIGEYRSYLQIPYIYFNKLFQIFAKKTTEITGYEVVMDGTWFNKSNPYWNKMVYILEKFAVQTDIEVGDGEIEEFRAAYYLLNLNSGGHIQGAPSTYAPSIQSKIATTFTNPAIEEIRTKFNNDEMDNVVLQQDSMTVRLTITNPYSVTGTYVGTAADNIIYNENSLFRIDFRLIDSNGNVAAECKNALITENNSFGEARFIDVNKIYVGNFVWDGNRTWHFDFKVNFDFVIQKGEVGDNFYIDCCVYQESDNPYLFYLNSVAQANRIAPQTISFNILAENDNFEYYGYGILNRSFAPFNLNELWNNEFNPFDEILNYCKQYRIGVFCDDINKKLIFKPLSTYFSDYKVLDWTDKLDMSKEYHIQPITFENKYLLFNYEKYETELNKQYNEKYGRNYGEYVLTTEYEFNTEEKKLFKYSKTTIPSTDLCLSWTNLYDNLKIIYTLPAEITAYNKDDDKKNVNVFGAMLFYKGIEKFDTTSAMRTVHITDDTDFQLLNQTYFYTQNGQDGRYIKTFKYPVLDIVANGNLCTFAIPNENYTYIPNSYDNTNGIYKNFWEKYLNERYNKQNKIVTCYLRLTPYDIANFQYNNFVKIENQLYMVNKIYDYQIDENQTTKVDLITIQDVNGYTDNNFKLFTVYNDKFKKWSYYMDYITLTEVGMEKTIYVTSNTPVTWSDPNNALQSMMVYYNNDKSTMTNGSGVIPAGDLVPVTFYMNEPANEFGDVILSNGIEEVKVSVALIYDYSFNIYTQKSNGEFVEWNSTSDYIEFRDVNEEYTLYITSNEYAPVSWSDTEAILQDVYINGKSGSGTITVGDKVPVKFTIGDLYDQEGNITFTNGEQDINVFVRIFVDRSFEIYDSDKTLWTSTDKIELQNTNPLTKTIYITSINSNVQWSANDNTLQDLYINGKAGSGIIPSGTLVPVTFEMDKEGDVETIISSVRFYTTQQSTDIPVNIYYNEIFKIYRWDGEVWDEDYGYIDLSPTNQTQVLYLDANSDVEWSDVNSTLQGLGINVGGDREDWGEYVWGGSGTIYAPSNYKPIYFGIDTSLVQGRNEGKIEFYNGRHSWYVDVVLRDS